MFSHEFERFSDGFGRIVLEDTAADNSISITQL
jgi:hypothetical protein